MLPKILAQRSEEVSGFRCGCIDVRYSVAYDFNIGIISSDFKMVADNLDLSELSDYL